MSQQQQIALLGADHGGRQALAHALAPRLQGSSLFAQAIEDSGQLQSPVLVLLLAPSNPDGDEEGLRWREWLVQAGMAFSVLHGNAQDRLDGAWRLIAPLLGLAPSQDLRAGSTSRWIGSCDKCSDPACEHRLFQDLLQDRLQGATRREQEPGY